MASLREQLLVFIARTGAQAKSRRKAIRQFSDRNSFVYFGTVDQHTDDHKVIRGFSASLTHTDDSYSVGSYDGYDVTLVDRSDIIPVEGGKTEAHQWLIAEFRLQLAKDIPHFFLIPTHHGSTHYKKVFSSLRALEKVTLLNHSGEFVNRYDVYSVPDQAVAVDELLQPDITQTLAAHFWPFAVEVWEGSVYVYVVEPKLDDHVLSTLIKNGVWLAQTLDSNTVL